MKFWAVILILVFGCEAQGQLLPVKKNGKWGLIDTTGKLVLPIIYDAVQTNEESVWVEVTKFGQLGLVNTLGQEIFLKNVDDYHIFNDTAFGYYKKGKWGVLNHKKHDIISPKWDAISGSKTGLFYVSTGEKKALFSNSGKQLTPFIYNYIQQLRTEYFRALIGDSLHVLNQNGQVLFTELESRVSFKEWPAVIINVDDKLGIGHIESGIKSSCKWYKYDRLNDELFHLSTYTESVVYNAMSGQFIECAMGADIKKYNDSLFAIYQNKQWGLFTPQPKIILNPIYQNLRYDNGLIIATDTNGKKGAYKSNGQCVLEQRYTHIERVNLGAIKFGFQGKSGLASPSGRLILQPDNYSSIMVYPGLIKAKGSAGALIYEIDDNWNIIDRYEYKNVRTVYLSNMQTSFASQSFTNPQSPSLARPEGWFNGKTPGQIDNKWGFRDSSGRIKITPRFLNVQFLDNGRAILFRKNKDIDKETYTLDGSYIVNERWGLATSLDGNIIASDNYWYLDHGAAESANGEFITGIKPDGSFKIIASGKIESKENFTFIDSLKGGYARVAKGGYMGISKSVSYPYNIKSQFNFRQQFKLPLGKLGLKKLSNQYVKIENAKWGYLDSSGSFTIEPQFDFAYQFEAGLAIVILNNNWGLINESGEFIIPAKYEKIERIIIKGKHYFKTFTKAPRYGYINTNGTLIIQPEYRSVLTHQNSKIGVKTKRGWTLNNYEGQSLIDTHFSDLIVFKDGYYGAKVGRAWKIIDAENQQIPFAFRQIEALNKYGGWTKENGMYQQITSTGESVNKRRYSSFSTDSNGKSIVKIDGKMGFINTSGKYIIKPKYDYLGKFSQNGLAIYRHNRKFGLIDTLGNVQIPALYQNMGIWSEGFSNVSLNGDWYIIKENGNTKKLLKGVYDCQLFIEGYAPIKKDGKWGYIDTSGSFKIEAQFDECTPFMDSMALVRYQNKQYLINYSGVLNLRFYGELIYPYQNGIAVVKRKGNFVFVDKTGKALYSKEFEKAEQFNTQGLAAVKYGGKWGLINQQGQFVMQPRFAKIGAFNEGIASVRTRGTYGLHNAQGEIEIDNIYDDLECQTNGIVKTQINNQIGYYKLPKSQWIWN